MPKISLDMPAEIIADLKLHVGDEKKYVSLADIQSGKFTKQWMEECKNGQKNFLATRAKLAEHPVEKVGANLRAMMPWIGKKKLVDSDKS